MNYKMRRGRRSAFQNELLGMLNAGATQQEIANMLGVSQPCVSDWLHGKTTPRIFKKKKVKPVVKRDPMLEVIEQVEDFKRLLQELVNLKS